MPGNPFAVWRFWSMEKTAKAPSSQGSNIPRAEGQRLAKRLQGLYSGYTGGYTGDICTASVLVRRCYGMSQGTRRLSWGQLVERVALNGWSGSRPVNTELVSRASRRGGRRHSAAANCRLALEKPCFNP